MLKQIPSAAQWRVCEGHTIFQQQSIIFPLKPLSSCRHFKPFVFDLSLQVLRASLGFVVLRLWEVLLLMSSQAQSQLLVLMTRPAPGRSKMFSITFKSAPGNFFIPFDLYCGLTIAWGCGSPLLCPNTREILCLASSINFHGVLVIWMLLKLSV